MKYRLFAVLAALVPLVVVVGGVLPQPSTAVAEPEPTASTADSSPELPDVPSYADYDYVYLINDFSYMGLTGDRPWPNTQPINCVDRNAVKPQDAKLKNVEPEVAESEVAEQVDGWNPDWGTPEEWEPAGGWPENAVDHCTLRQALISANALASTAEADKSVLITLDLDQFESDWADGDTGGRDGSGNGIGNGKSQFARPAFSKYAHYTHSMYYENGLSYGDGHAEAKPVINLSEDAFEEFGIDHVDDLMCESDCGDYAGEDGRAAYLVAKDNLTIDFLGRLGIASWDVKDTADDTTLRYSTFAIKADNVTIRNINGLFSSETAVMVNDGVTGFRLENGHTEQHLPSTSFPWSGNWLPWASSSKSTKRFVVVLGSHDGTSAKPAVTIANWAVGHLNHNYTGNYAVLFVGPTDDATQGTKTVGATIDHLYTYSTSKVGKCYISDASGCAGGRALTSEGRTTIEGLTIKDSVFAGTNNDGDAHPVIDLSSSSTLHDMTVSNSSFVDITATNTIHMSGNTVDGLNFQENKFTSNSTPEGSVVNFSSSTMSNVVLDQNKFDGSTASAVIDLSSSSTVDNMTVSNSSFKGITATNTIDVSGSTVDVLDFQYNTFTSNRTPKVSEISFSSSTISNVVLDHNQFDGSTAATVIDLSSSSTVDNMTVSYSSFVGITATNTIDMSGSTVDVLDFHNNWFTSNSTLNGSEMNFSSSTMSDVLLQENKFDGGEATNVIDFTLAELTETTLDHNTFTGKAAFGINFLDSQSTTLRLVGNSMTGTMTSHVSAGHVSFRGATVVDAVLQGNKFISDPSSFMWALKVIDFSGNVSNIKLIDNTFKNLLFVSSVISFASAQNDPAADFPVTLSDNRIEGVSSLGALVTFAGGHNFWLDISDNKFLENQANSYPWLELSGDASYLDLDKDHPSVISNNTFSNTQSSDQNAIYVKGAVSSDAAWDGPERNSNLQILNNSFSGFTGSTIYLNQTGGVRVQYNNFSATSAPAGTAAPYFPDEFLPSTGGPSAVRFLFNDGGYANKDVKPWLPANPSVLPSVSQYACQAGGEVLFKAPNAVYPSSYAALPVPYVVDVYASADAGIPGKPITSFTVTEDGVTERKLALPLDQVSGKYVRTQVTSRVDGVYQSSQYSSAIKVRDAECVDPDYTITKTGYSDEGHTQMLSQETALPEGTRVYWKYTVENKGNLLEELTVTVTDDQKNDADGNRVCTLHLGRGESDVCIWDQAVYPTD